MEEERVVIIPDWQFSNGTYIFKSNKIQINPTSKEGNQIEYLLSLQNITKLENEEQTEFVNKLKNAKSSEEAIKILQEHGVTLYRANK
ncbi:MAG: hypothetical protein O6761_03710 [Thaumarchaeota archaeon]|nr:hypothetical protein [Nitrososphaerota archaeon]